MHFPDFVDHLRQLGRPAFSTHDAVRILGSGRRTAAVTLHRWIRRGLLRQVARGQFALPETDPLVVASSLGAPGYVSFLAGLAHHGRTTQLPREVAVVSPRPRRPVTFGQTTIRTVVLRPDRITGYHQELLRGGVIAVGDLEKVLVDCLLLPQHCPPGETAEAFRHPFDAQRLAEYAARAGSSACRKRIGYLAEQAGIDLLEPLEAAGLLPGYEPLNPLLPRRGERKPRWRLIVNDVLPGPAA